MHIVDQSGVLALIRFRTLVSLCLLGLNPCSVNFLCVPLCAKLMTSSKILF